MTERLHVWFCEKNWLENRAVTQSKETDENKKA